MGVLQLQLHKYCFVLPGALKELLSAHDFPVCFSEIQIYSAAVVYDHWTGTVDGTDGLAFLC